MRIQIVISSVFGFLKQALWLSLAAFYLVRVQIATVLWINGMAESGAIESLPYLKLSHASY